MVAYEVVGGFSGDIVGSVEVGECVAEDAFACVGGAVDEGCAFGVLAVGVEGCACPLLEEEAVAGVGEDVGEEGVPHLGDGGGLVFGGDLDGGVVAGVVVFGEDGAVGVEVEGFVGADDFGGGGVEDDVGVRSFSILTTSSPWLWR